jgi:hypothetical protein
MVSPALAASSAVDYSVVLAVTSSSAVVLAASAVSRSEVAVARASIRACLASTAA